jgi:hypothetical protein
MRSRADVALKILLGDIRQESIEEPSRGAVDRHGHFPAGTAVMNSEIDAIVKAFAPEMERITDLLESKEGKVRIAENWLRRCLEKFEEEIRTDCTKKNQ